MLRPLLGAALTCLLLAAPVAAQDRVTLGWGRLFSNDAMGDTRDRWRTGAYVVSRVRGPSWSGALPQAAGEIVELRLGAQTIAPASLTDPDPDDRRYAGLLTFGVHTHFARAGVEFSLGADLVVTGPQTGIGTFQRKVHDIFNLPEPQVLDNQIGNGVYPTLVAEAGRSFALGDRVTLRPFVEAQAGIETLVRVGGDIVVGDFARGALMLRDGTTGQRYTGIAGLPQPGFSFTFGGDVARVFDSVLLPSGGAATLSDSRSRLRAGLHWQGKSSDIYYGLTWLGREFDEQPKPQLVGSLRLGLRF